MRLLFVFFGLAALVLLSFFIWGDSLMEMFSQSGTTAWLMKNGKWAWLLAILLLMGDLLLPLPATLIMAAIGYIYGPIAGGLISAAGSFLAGSMGYWLCRVLGEKTARRLLGEKDYMLGKKLSGSVGGWVVVLSRERAAVRASRSDAPAVHHRLRARVGAVASTVRERRSRARGGGCARRRDPSPFGHLEGGDEHGPDVPRGSGYVAVDGATARRSSPA